MDNKSNVIRIWEWKSSYITVQLVFTTFINITKQKLVPWNSRECCFFSHFIGVNHSFAFYTHVLYLASRIKTHFSSEKFFYMSYSCFSRNSHKLLFQRLQKQIDKTIFSHKVNWKSDSVDSGKKNYWNIWVKLHIKEDKNYS